MNKQQIDILKEECIDYILNLPINVNWRRSQAVMTWLSSCRDSEKQPAGIAYNQVPSWEEEDGRDMHLRILFGVNDDYYNERKGKNIYNGLQVIVQRYSFRSYEWDREMGFVVKSLEQFKHIITGIIKTH